MFLFLLGYRCARVFRGKILQLPTPSVNRKQVSTSADMDRLVWVDLEVWPVYIDSFIKDNII